jgi:hypothetical protein
MLVKMFSRGLSKYAQALSASTLDVQEEFFFFKDIIVTMSDGIGAVFECKFGGVEVGMSCS